MTTKQKYDKKHLEYWYDTSLLNVQEVNSQLEWYVNRKVCDLCVAIHTVYLKNKIFLIIRPVPSICYFF